VGLLFTDNDTYDVSGITNDYNDNQLKGVEDAAPVVRGFKDGASATTEYLYDDNGNMRKDLNKGISLIEYNVLNLPEKIVFADGKEISYVYSASGEKLQNVVGGKTLTYCGGFVYENGILQYVLNSEGRYVVSGSSGAYEYNLTDHLGNVRAVVDGNGAIKQKSNYYPFGMTFDTYEGSTNKYLYNGKEKQEGTEWLDYGARMYACELGRWMCVDPMADQRLWVSPYNYCQNNPLSRIDPNGMMDIVKPTPEALKVIKNTLSEEDAKFVQLDKDGNIDAELINSNSSESQNFSNLVEMVNDDKTVEVHTLSNEQTFDYKDKNGVMNKDGKVKTDYYKGELVYMNATTLTPSDNHTEKPSSQQSPDNNVYVYIPKNLSILKSAEIMSHELYGHSYIYMIMGPNKNKHIINGCTDMNKSLMNRIKRSINETNTNFKNRK